MQRTSLLHCVAYTESIHLPQTWSQFIHSFIHSFTRHLANVLPSGVQTASMNYGNTLYLQQNV